MILGYKKYSGFDDIYLLFEKPTSSLDALYRDNENDVQIYLYKALLGRYLMLK